MVLVCPFIMKIHHRLLFNVIFYFRIDKITKKYRFQGIETWVSVVAGYRNTIYIYIYQVTAIKCGKYANIIRWVEHSSVCCDVP